MHSTYLSPENLSYSAFPLNKDGIDPNTKDGIEYLCEEHHSKAMVSFICLYREDFYKWRMLFKGVSLLLFLVFWVLSIGPASEGLVNSEPHMCGSNGRWAACVHEENYIGNDTTEPGMRGVGWRLLIMVNASPWVLVLSEQCGHSGKEGTVEANVLAVP